MAAGRGGCPVSKASFPRVAPRCFTTRNTLDKNNLKPKVNRVELDYSVVSYTKHVDPPGCKAEPSKPPPPATR